MTQLLKMSVAVAVLGWGNIWARPTAFVAFQPEAGFQLPEIVLQYDPVAKTGVNWADIKGLPMQEGETPNLALDYATTFLHEGLQRMTGRDFPIISKNDLTKGIILVLLKNAPSDIQNDPEIQRALRPDAKDPYAAKEAFFIRSEKSRLLVVSNTAEGLSDAVAELLESVDYAVLGMGPDWIHAPDYRTRPLDFAIDHADRPSFYIRNLIAHSAQQFGTGTILSGLSDPADEGVYASYARWLIGTRMYGSSMPPYPGHAMQAYHKAILDRMNQLGKKEGFLIDLKSGPANQRPAASPQVKEMVWMNTTPDGKLAADQFFYCDGTAWQPYAVDSLGTVDLSSPIARDVIFQGMIKAAEIAFAAHPDDPAIFPMDMEDGETAGAERDRLMSHKNWYPDYLASEKLPFGRPYALNGFKGLHQPTETWDPTSPSDTIYGAANYFLHEFDKWVDSLPEEQRVTATGKSKKDLIRCSFLSYNFHDVPPDFNLDKRIRVMIVAACKDRGFDKWKNICTPVDMARALQVMLPGAPSSSYFCYSFSWYRDGGPEGIPAFVDASPEAVSKFYGEDYKAGFRAVTSEIDLNFGKNGLLYYLATQMLWNASLTGQDLDKIRDRWFQRSFGSGWKEMKSYYDFLLPDNFLANSPNSWAQAIRLIDAAQARIDAAKEPDAQRRIDDVKQYWYGHYLMDSGKYTTNSAEIKEFLWKGQMSYMTGMEGLLGRDFKSNDVKAVVGPVLSAGPAHYTHAETRAWWAKVLDFWPPTPATLFSDATLANGKPAKTVDLNDLVLVKEFQAGPGDHSFLYNGEASRPPTFLMVADKKDAPVGFELAWPYNKGDPNYEARDLSYGVEEWDPIHQEWQTWIDQTTTTSPSQEVADKQGTKVQLVEVKLKAPRAGVYRFSIGIAGNLSQLGSPAFQPLASTYTGHSGFTYFGEEEGLTQSGVYFYIPKGTKTLDLDVWDIEKAKFVTLHKGLPSGTMSVSRKIDIGAMGAHRVPLRPGEDGSLALIEGNEFNFPFLYSVPKLWAGSPVALLVPRAVAEADGLTVEPATK
jgi:hypothetical protein